MREEQYEITNQDEKNEIDISSLRERLNKFLDILAFNDLFSITFISDEEIKELNSEYRDKDEATDVLTFRLSDDDSFPSVEEVEEEAGDIFISIDSVKRNAEEFSVPLFDEITRVSLHGILHLMGYDHATNDFSKEEMLIKQEEILKSVF